jgi:hypothetical protein
VSPSAGEPLGRHQLELTRINPKLAEAIKNDADTNGMGSRVKFCAIVEIVVDLGDRKPK